MRVHIHNPMSMLLAPNAYFHPAFFRTGFPHTDHPDADLMDRTHLALSLTLYRRFGNHFPFPFPIVDLSHDSFANYCLDLP
jgi:hypothetical protein